MTEMKPDEFKALMDKAFVTEPAQPSSELDAVRARRSVRVRGGLIGLAVAATASSVVGLGLAATVGDRSTVGQVVGSTPTLADAEVVRRCIAGSDGASWVLPAGMAAPRVRTTMAGASVVTRAEDADQTIATVRSGDGQTWGWCSLAAKPDNGIKTMMGLYRTHASPGPGTDTVASLGADRDPYLDVTPSAGGFSVVWQDRRAPSVKAVKITNLDGTERWAEVKDGYLSYKYTGESYDPSAYVDGALPVKQIVFYDYANKVLAQLHDGPRSLDAYPSLAFTRTSDLEQCPNDEPC